jgi:hypothetical protein
MPASSSANKKLGRRAVVTDTRTLKLSKFFTAELPPPPAAVDYTKGGKSWGEMLNDELGDCTIAGLGHAIQVWTINASKEATVGDDTILSTYESWCGYDPSNPATDQGGVELYVLKDFKAKGLAGHTLDAFAAVLPANQEHVKQAINLFTGLYIGLDVPAYIMPPNGDVPTFWKLAPDKNNASIGGHCVYVTGYDAEGVNFISWGSNYKMGWGWWAKFVDEAYALISKDYIEASGNAPSGFDMDALETDLVNIS